VHYHYAAAEIGAERRFAFRLFLPPQMGQILFVSLVIFFWSIV